MMKRTAIGTVVLLACIGFVNVWAQGKKKKPVAKEPIPTNVEVMAVVDSIADSAYVMDTSTATRYFLFPEFYSYWPITKGDTIIKYQCYDAENSYINIDTLSDIGNVWHIHFLKVFNNYLHTYIDSEGKPKASSAAKIIFRYDRIDNDTWKSTDNISDYIGTLKEDRNDIVRQDTTTVLNTVTGGKRLTIRKYYKIIEIKHKGEIETDK
ncbi:MAG: hypothetical protein JWQ38_2365 [Flavipsychrobacter sp.]|nr:hypothetical protein [Flavipsychrobacter sp.]